MASDPSCPVCRTADIVCGKWTLLLVRDLAEGRSRFCELERSLNGISPRTLSLRLRALEEEGIVERQTYAEVPPRVEYSLTDKGRALIPIIEGMRYLRRALAGRRVRHRAGAGPRARRRRRLAQASSEPPQLGRAAASPRRVAGDRAGVAPSARRATLAAVGGTTITRRRALVLGAAAGLGSLLARPFSALGRGAPARARGFGMAVGPGISRVPRAGCCARRGASTCSACAARTRRAVASRCACAAAAGSWSPWVALAVHGDHAPDTGTGERASDPVWAGGCDELQLRTSRRLRGALRVHFVAVPAAARPVAARARGGQRPSSRPRPSPARRRRSSRARRGAADAVPPRAAPDYGVVQLAFVHHTVTANDYTPDQSALDRARHRQVPPRHQRLERHRLQLPRRPVRAGLRGPRGRDRAGGRRRPGAGLQLAVHRRRGARHLQRRADPRGRDGVDHAAARLEALAARRAVRGRPDDRLRRRQPEPLPVGDARWPCSASPGTATATAPSAPATRSTPSCPSCAGARRRWPGRSWPMARSACSPPPTRSTTAPTRSSRARSSAPTRPPAPARPSRCRSAAPAAPG